MEQAYSQAGHDEGDASALVGASRLQSVVHPANAGAGSWTVDTRRVLHWPAEYKDKLLHPEDAFKLVQSGDRVYMGGGCGEPIELAQGLARRKDELHNVEIVHILRPGTIYTLPGMENSFRVNSLFIGRNVREAVQAGQADFTPVLLYTKSLALPRRLPPLDVALISLSPPDEHGYCSYGVEVAATKPAVETHA